MAGSPPARGTGGIIIGSTFGNVSRNFGGTVEMTPHPTCAPERIRQAARLGQMSTHETAIQVFIERGETMVISNVARICYATGKEITDSEDI